MCIEPVRQLVLELGLLHLWSASTRGGNMSERQWVAARIAQTKSKVFCMIRLWIGFAESGCCGRVCIRMANNNYPQLILLRGNIVILMAILANKRLSPQPRSLSF